MTEKPFVYDLPIVKKQKFKVSLPDKKGRIIVERKEVIREQHNMGCTDGMKPGEKDIMVDYKVWQEVDLDTTEKVISLIEKEFEK